MKAIGCLTVVLGFFSGGMIGIFVAWIVTKATGCVPAEGLPACYMNEGGRTGVILGAVSLPLLTILRIRRSRRGADSVKSL